jgi:3-oxoacyl-[acyl-carrier protein] reductase
LAIEGRAEGKHAVVIGAASPIGRASALLLAWEGAEVLAVDHDGRGVTELCAEVRAGGGVAVHCIADASSEHGIAAIARSCSHMWNHVDVLVNCSGIVDYWTVGDEGSLDNWTRVFSVNIMGPALLAKALFPALGRSSGGSVIFLGSIDGMNGNPSLPAYSASKAGLIPLTHVLADDWGPLGVRVNCLATGLVGHHGPADPAPASSTTDFERLKDVTPLRRAPSPGEVAEVVAFLASKDSSYITGSVIPVDGGRLAATPGTSRR